MPSADRGLRASDADRAAAVAGLKRHYEAGRLTLAELEERTHRAYDARTLGELDALSQDLPAAPADPAAAPPAPPAAAPVPRAFGRELGRFLVVAAFLVAIWAVSGRGYFWPVWPILGWGLALAMRGTRGERSGERHRHREHRRPRSRD